MSSFRTNHDHFLPVLHLYRIKHRVAKTGAWSHYASNLVGVSLQAVEADELFFRHQENTVRGCFEVIK